MAQGKRIHLLTRQTQEEPSRHGTTKPVSPDYLSTSTQRPCSATRKTTAMRSLDTETRQQPPLATTDEGPHTPAKIQHSQRQTNKSLKRKKKGRGGLLTTVSWVNSQVESPDPGFKGT